ncbi:MAG: response regulator [Gammaproteobacteria bacterium]|nr:response regulator [Gammaproteobacteria bacterium]
MAAELHRNKKPAIHIVEEDKIVREGLVRLCSRLEADIKAYSSIEHLLEVGRPAPPGCVVVEVNLPKKEVAQLLQRLRNGDAGVPVIFLSSGSDIETAVEVMREGAFDFIEKPFLSRKLLHRIDEAVRASI